MKKGAGVYSLKSSISLNRGSLYQVSGAPSPSSKPRNRDAIWFIITSDGVQFKIQRKAQCFWLSVAIVSLKTDDRCKL